MQIDALMVTDGSPYYYDEGFRAALEPLLTTYRNSPNTQQQAVPPNQGIVYRSDFFGYLTSLQLQPCYHWFTMRLNGFFSPFEFNESVQAILIPNTQDLNRVLMLWMASQGIKT